MEQKKVNDTMSHLEIRLEVERAVRERVSGSHKLKISKKAIKDWMNYIGIDYTGETWGYYSEPTCVNGTFDNHGQPLMSCRVSKIATAILKSNETCNPMLFLVVRGNLVMSLLNIKFEAKGK